jgi:hypothetical protein
MCVEGDKFEHFLSPQKQKKQRWTKGEDGSAPAFIESQKKSIQLFFRQKTRCVAPLAAHSLRYGR